MPAALCLQVLSVGAFGVRIFFFLSAFLLSLRFARRHAPGEGHVRLGGYYLRRLARIHAPYLIHLVILTGLAIALGSTGLIWDDWLAARPDLFAFVLRHNLASMLYLHDVMAGYANPLNCVLWTMEVLVQFYLFLPFMAVVFRLKSVVLRRLLLILVIATSTWPTLFDGTVVQRTFVPHLPYFALGLLFADLYVRKPQIFAARTILWDIAGLVGWVVLVALLISGTRHVVQPWLLGLCCLSVFRGRVLKHVFTHPFALAIGAMSYTIYLYHYLVVLGVGRAVQHMIGRNASLGSLGLHCAAVLGTTFVISVLLFRIFERPFMDQHWYPRLWDRLARRESNAAAST